MKAQTSIAGWIGLFLLATGGRVAAQDTIRARISFAYNQSRLSEAECRRLDSLVAIAADCPLRHLRITGNTDQRGSAAYNLGLSERRASEVVDYLASRGMVTDRLEVLSQGKSMPLAPGEDEASLAVNRRVEVEMVLWVESPPMTVSTENPVVAAYSGMRKFPGDLRVIYPQDERSCRGLSCFQPKALTDVQKMLKKKLTTMSAEGVVLAPAAILEWVQANGPVNGSERLPTEQFGEALQVMVPVRDGTCRPEDVGLWELARDSSGSCSWVKSTDSVRVVKQGRGRFYSFTAVSTRALALMCQPATSKTMFFFRDLQAGKLTLVYAKWKMIISGEEVLPGLFEVEMPLVNEVPRVYATATGSGEESFEIRGLKLSDCRRNLFGGEYILRKKDFRKAPPLRIKKVDKEEVIFGYAEP